MQPPPLPRSEMYILLVIYVHLLNRIILIQFGVRFLWFLFFIFSPSILLERQYSRFEGSAVFFFSNSWRGMSSTYLNKLISKSISSASGGTLAFDVARHINVSEMFYYFMRLHSENACTFEWNAMVGWKTKNHMVCKNFAL